MDKDNFSNALRAAAEQAIGILYSDGKDRKRVMSVFDDGLFLAIKKDVQEIMDQEITALAMTYAGELRTLADAHRARFVTLMVARQARLAAEELEKIAYERLGDF